MEIIAGSLHRAFPLDDASRVGEARRHAAQLALELDWSEVDAGRLAIVVTELGTNLFRHATGGRLLIAAGLVRGEVEVLSIDTGPGIANLPRSMSDGFSTGGSPGTGLGAVQRLSDDFHIHSSVPQGTVVVARLRRLGTAAHTPTSAVEIGAVCLSAPGETVSGDAWAACVNGTDVALLVADGLGHGPDAQEAAHEAMAVFAEDPFYDLPQMLESAHRRLRSTRGAAVSVFRLDDAQERVRSVGAGNVAARVVSGNFDRSVMSQHGTVGVQIRRVEETSVAWPPHALLVAYTDGLESRWSAELLMPVLTRDPTLAAALLVRDHCRGRDDVTVVVMRRKVH